MTAAVTSSPKYPSSAIRFAIAYGEFTRTFPPAPKLTLAFSKPPAPATMIKPASDPNSRKYTHVEIARKRRATSKPATVRITKPSAPWRSTHLRFPAQRRSTPRPAAPRHTPAPAGGLRPSVHRSLPAARDIPPPPRAPPRSAIPFRGDRGRGRRDRPPPIRRRDG